MLTVAKVTQAQAAGYAEYLEGRSQPSQLGDYYLKDGDRVEAPGRWISGAAEFGIDAGRPVSGDELRALMAVRRPDNGQALRRAGGSGEAVAAIDATFSAPKSVSAVWALAGSGLRERIEYAHERAIDRALGYSLEVVAMVRERLDAERVLHVKPRELIATSWRHTTARAVEDEAPDPQLHSHVLLHSAIRPDAKVVAIDSRSWLIHRRELGAAYRTELAHELAQLGFQIERGTGRGGRYFELRGVPRELIDCWSSRHWQVQEAITARLRERRELLEALLAAGGPQAKQAVQRLEALAAANRLTPKEDRIITTSTRATKDGFATRADLDRHWSRTAKRLGFERREVEQLTALPSQPEPASQRELRARLTEFDATFTEREARAVALEVSAGLPIGECLKRLQDLRPSGDLLALAGGLMTTRAHRALERRTIAVAQSLTAEHAPEIAAELVQAEVSALDHRLRAEGGSLSEEQRRAISLASSHGRLVMIEGHAGSGKSTTLQAIARAHQQSGRRIIVTSTAALAAERLAGELRAAGVEAEAYSTVALDAALASERIILDPRVTVIHEEAALASSREQQRLLSQVEDSRGRVILLGDPRQSQAVGAGGLWPELKQAVKASQAHVELTRNVRALDEQDRDAQRLFREGEHERALESYAQRGRVSIAEQQRHAEDQALEQAQADRQAGRRTLVIAQSSNEHLGELNARAQAIRAEHNELGEHAIRVAGRPYQLRPGDEIQVRHSIRHPEIGELRNGITGQVIAADPERDLVTLGLTGGQEAQLDRGQLDDADVRLAYVQHPFLAQGQTADTAHLIVSEHTTAEGSYVAITRARQETHLHASREQLGIDEPGEQLEALAEHMGRSEPEIPSIRYPLAHEEQIRDYEARELAREDSPGQGPARDRVHQRTRRLLELDDSADAWREAMSALARYRTGFAGEAMESVSAKAGHEAGYFQQRYERRQAAATVLDALARLDPDIQRDRETQERVLEQIGLARGSHPHDRGLGFEW